MRSILVLFGTPLLESIQYATLQPALRAEHTAFPAGPLDRILPVSRPFATRPNERSRPSSKNGRGRPRFGLTRVRRRRLGADEVAAFRGASSGARRSYRRGLFVLFSNARWRIQRIANVSRVRIVH